MSNHFFRVTSEGGYFGRLCWVNTGSLAGTPWGRFRVLPEVDDYPEILWNPYASRSTWSGSRQVIRYVTQSLPLELES